MRAGCAASSPTSSATDRPALPQLKPTPPRREIAQQPFALFKGLCVETPFLDAELWSFLDSLPYDMVADQRFHTDTILRAYPAHARILVTEAGGYRLQP